MGWIVGLVVAYLLMAICNRLWGNPTIILGLLYVGGCAWVLGTIVVRMIGGSM